MTIARTIERLEDKVHRLNTASLKLELVPSEAKHAAGRTHEVSLRTKLLPTDPDALLSVDLPSVLMPSLQRVKSGFSAELSGLQDTLLERENEQVCRDEAAQERDDELAALRASLQRLEREEKTMKAEHAAELARRKAETEELEEQLSRSKTAAGQSVKDSDVEVARLQKELDEFALETKKRRETMYAQLVSSIDMLFVHKDNVEKQLASLEAHCASKKEMLQPLLVDEPVDLE